MKLNIELDLEEWCDGEDNLNGAIQNKIIENMAYRLVSDMRTPTLQAIQKRVIEMVEKETLEAIQKTSKDVVEN